MKTVDEETQRLLREICHHFANEDRAVRDRQIRQWRKLKYYWDGFQRLWWSETAHDWRVYDQQVLSPDDNTYYDKPLNVFKAYLESIIAALSASVPDIVCFPDDADEPLDLQTARAGNKIYELISKHNNVNLLWLHALFILCTEGLVAAYNYSEEKEEYGTYEVDKYDEVEEEQQQKVCPLCGMQLGPNDLNIEEQHEDEYNPGNDDVLAAQGNFCANCLQIVDPEYRNSKVIVQRLVGKTKHPKSRQCIEVYGGLFVKVANYAKRQADTPYLQWAYETHYSNVIERYDHLRDKLRNQGGLSMGGGYELYEQWGRIPTAYFNEYPMHNCTVRHTWLRPAAFNILAEKKDVDHLNKLFPDGCKVVFINHDTFAEACNECLDDHWTLTHNPLADYVHHDPLGKVLSPIQEITNDLGSLVIQTIEHGIPQTFADPGVLDFDAYGQTESLPGAIFPAIPKSGQKVSDAFYEVKTATLSGEVLPVFEKIQEMGQLISGALPTIFGGAVTNSSKTASQYGMMRAQSLQRLQNTWKMLSSWWKELFGKVIPAYMKDIQADEKFVTRDKQGNFANVLIRRAELDGKLGNIELESAEQLPISWAQKKEIVMTLLQAANPEVMAAISSPENIPILQDAIGLNDFHMPGEDDRETQYEEIQLLIASQPISMPGGMDQMGQPVSQSMPSVEVQPLVDNHQIHADTCRTWAISPAGRQVKRDNPDGYKNVLLHMQQHVAIYTQAMMQQSATMQQQGPDQNKQNQNQFKPVAQPVNNNVNRATQ